MKPTELTPFPICWGIYDTQLDQFRDEDYESEETARHEFAEYWKEIAFDEMWENFDFEHYMKQHNIPIHQLTEDEERAMVQAYMNEWSDEEFLDFYGFQVRQLDAALFN